MTRSRQGARRRERDQAADRQQQLIYGGVAVVMALVVLIVLVGLYFTQWRPPRAHVLTVQGRDYRAAEVVDRGTYLAVFEGRGGTIDDIARSTLDVLVDEAVLRLRGPALVGEVTEADVRRELHVRLGLQPEDAEDRAATPVATAEATPAATAEATAAATAEATPAATGEATPAATAEATPGSPTPVSDEAFATAYRDFLRRAGLEQALFERIVEAQLIARRLQDQFLESLGDAGPQVRLDRIRVPDFAVAEAVRQELAEGADFAELKERHGIDDPASPGSEAGEEDPWQPVALLEPEVAEAVRDLEAGEVSEPVERDFFFEIYLVQERDAERPFTELDQLRIANDELDAWLRTERQHVEVQRDLSVSEERWINDRVLERAREIAGSLASRAR